LLVDFTASHVRLEGKWWMEWLNIVGSQQVVMESSRGKNSYVHWIILKFL
jgi:uncharacterized membrane-anchored protein